MTTVDIIRDNKSIKKPELFSKNTFKLFATKILVFRAGEFTRFHTGIEITITENTDKFYCSLDRDFTEAVPGKNRIYLGLLNKSFIKDFQISKNDIIGFICFETKQNLTFNHAAPK